MRSTLCAYKWMRCDKHDVRALDRLLYRYHAYMIVLLSYECATTPQTNVIVNFHPESTSLLHCGSQLLSCSPNRVYLFAPDIHLTQISSWRSTIYGVACSATQSKEVYEGRKLLQYAPMLRELLFYWRTSQFFNDLPISMSRITNFLEIFTLLVLVHLIFIAI